MAGGSFLILIFEIKLLPERTEVFFNSLFFFYFESFLDKKTLV